MPFLELQLSATLTTPVRPDSYSESISGLSAFPGIHCPPSLELGVDSGCHPMSNFSVLDFVNGGLCTNPVDNEKAGEMSSRSSSRTISQTSQIELSLATAPATVLDRSLA